MRFRLVLEADLRQERPRDEAAPLHEYQNLHRDVWQQKADHEQDILKQQEQVYKMASSEDQEVVRLAEALKEEGREMWLECSKLITGLRDQVVAWQTGMHRADNLDHVNTFFKHINDASKHLNVGTTYIPPGLHRALQQDAEGPGAVTCAQNGRQSPSRGEGCSSRAYLVADPHSPVDWQLQSR